MSSHSDIETGHSELETCHSDRLPEEDNHRYEHDLLPFDNQTKPVGIASWHRIAGIKVIRSAIEGLVKAEDYGYEKFRVNIG